VATCERKRAGLVLKQSVYARASLKSTSGMVMRKQRTVAAKTTTGH
jgi:hypothetical protein